MLREGVYRERNDYLKSKIKELIDYLQGEGIRSIGNTPFKEIWSISPDIEVLYKTVKDTVDVIYSKKQEEASLYANKIINETDLVERGMRIFEKPLLEAELKLRNETEVADLKENIKINHALDVELKHRLIESK